MADTSCIIERPLFQRVTQCAPPPEPHKWGERKRIPASETQTTFEQHEKRCSVCGLVCITVMKGRGYRAYRWGDAPFQFDDGCEPECEVIETSPALKGVEGKT